MSRYYIGIDLGGTNVRVATFDIDYCCVTHVIKKNFIRYQRSEDEFNNNIVNLLDKIVVMNGGNELAGIGISTAFLFNRNTGIVTEWPNNPKWKNMKVSELLQERYKVPVIMEDDANSAALGEQLVGAAFNKDSFIYVTISTGIGCGIIINDKLVIGEHGWAGELGHIKVTNGNIKCKCGSIGCLQAVASGPAILKKYQQTSSYQQLRQKEKIDVKDIVRLAHKGDSEANIVFKEAGNYIGKTLGNMIMLLDVSLIVIGGGVINAGKVLTSAIDDGLNEVLNKRRKVELKYSELQDCNGVYGALSKIDQYINGERTIKMESDQNEFISKRWRNSL